MGRRRSRRVLHAAVAAVALSACGALSIGEDCSLRPVGMPEARLRIGPAIVAASCPGLVEVDGRTYAVGVGRWLEETLLDLEPYSAISRANQPVVEPVVYALRGVDPHEFLLMRGDDHDDLGPMGPWMALYGESSALPADVCPYADPGHPQVPSECR